MEQVKMNPGPTTDNQLHFNVMVETAIEIASAKTPIVN